MIIDNKEYKDKTYIMGILNVTPDSFSDGGKHITLADAIRHAEQMVLDGADIIDVGGESTRLGHIQITDEEEIYRVVPIIEQLKKNIDVPISIDTYKSAVAEEALKAGAVLVNDIWGFKYDEKIAAVAKKYNAACCLMHNRTNTEYSDFVNDVLFDLQESIRIALDAGIPSEMIMTDPGVGFAKTYQQNLIITKNMNRLTSLGYPFLLGTSRKSMIGNALNLPVNERVEGTVATSVLAAVQGALFVRVHDVKENKRAICMTEAILKS